MVGYKKVNMDDFVQYIYIFEQDSKISTFNFLSCLTLPFELASISC